MANVVPGAPQDQFDNPDARYSQNPTLVPTFDQPTVSPGNANIPGSPGLYSLNGPSEFLSQFPRVRASQTATFSGTITTNDTYNIVITDPTFAAAGNAGGVVTSTYVIIAADTIDRIGAALARAVNNNTQLQAAGFYATSLQGVVTVFAPGGPVGNTVKFAATKTGAGTWTAGGATFAGGSGPIFVTDNFNYCLTPAGTTWSSGTAAASSSPRIQSFMTGKAYNIPAGIVAQMVTDGMPVF